MNVETLRRQIAELASPETIKRAESEGSQCLQYRPGAKSKYPHRWVEREDRPGPSGYGPTSQWAGGSREQAHPNANACSSRSSDVSSAPPCTRI